MSFGHLQDFSEAADALGALNLSEGWSSLSLRSRHSESGAQDSQLRAERGDPFESSRRSRRANVEEEEEEQYPAHNVSILHKSQSVSQSFNRLAGSHPAICKVNSRCHCCCCCALLSRSDQNLKPQFAVLTVACITLRGPGSRRGSPARLPIPVSAFDLNDLLLHF